MLLDADVGFLDSGRKYDRRGDVERTVLVMIMRALRASDVSTELFGTIHGGNCLVGTVDMYVDRLTCLSCLGVIAQFQRAFPNVKVRVACAFPPWLPRRLAFTRYYGVVRAQPRKTAGDSWMEYGIPDIKDG
eukprot:gnl/TRDRNA2_/TRDRNA2_163569_c1_seq1.p1 gnl/TRDRNA2_/TRDRNA2_163569_c1~~gnl/TRDRNA2_/TRDRNA2_163569_c1_seq1.p1  ORF type:complete len:132 (+),score=14.33 gnl/TRDRNA2_/TRDRNA2_163569_c1_seq1:96-491(+)